jgi:hypothetical protein
MPYGGTGVMYVRNSLGGIATNAVVKTICVNAVLMDLMMIGGIRILQEMVLRG